MTQDKAPSINEITGSILATKASTELYRNNYDRIFGKKKEPKKEILLLNKAMCDNCHEVIKSKHRHDFVSCSCGNLSVDGGMDYCKRNFGEHGYTELSMYANEDDIETIRKYFTWGSYGIEGNEPRKDILLKDLTDEHLQDIISTQKHIKGTIVEKFFNLEVEHRKEK